MNPTQSKPDALTYLLGTVALLAISVIPVIAVVMSEVQLGAKIAFGGYWLLGGAAIWWALRRFAKLGERLAALVGIVVGWYIVLQVLMILNTMIFRF